MSWNIITQATLERTENGLRFDALTTCNNDDAGWSEISVVMDTDARTITQWGKPKAIEEGRDAEHAFAAHILVMLAYSIVAVGIGRSVADALDAVLGVRAASRWSYLLSTGRASSMGYSDTSLSRDEIEGLADRFLAVALGEAEDIGEVRKELRALRAARTKAKRDAIVQYEPGMHVMIDGHPYEIVGRNSKSSWVLKHTTNNRQYKIGTARLRRLGKVVV